MSAIASLMLFITYAPLLATQAMPPTVAAGAKLVQVYAADRFFEGPTWDPKGKSLYFTAFDRDDAQILRLGPRGTVSVFADKTQGVTGTFLALDGRLLAAQSRGHRILAYDLATAKIEVLLYRGRLNQPNDVCQAPNGDIYFTDPDYKRRQTSGVYLLRRGERLHELPVRMPLPNGIKTSLDGKTLYISDSYERAWHSFPIAPDGTIGVGKVFFNPDTPNKNEPDGLTLDAKGNLYLAGRGGVWVVTPEGKPLGLIPVKEFVSNVTFGGADFDVLYLTCAKKVYSLKMALKGGRVGG